MIDWLLSTLGGWHSGLTEHRIQRKITNADAHLRMALAELGDIETDFAAHRAHVRTSIRATLVQLARYKHARGMIEGNQIMSSGLGDA